MSGGICNACSADGLNLTRTRRRARVWILELEKTVFILGEDVDAVEDCSSQPSVQQQRPRQRFIKNKKKKERKRKQASQLCVVIVAL